MSSVFKKTKDRKRPNSCWYIAYTDHDGVRRTTKGCPDKTATEALARKLASDAELRRRGVIDPKADGYRIHQSRPLAEHLADWKAFQLGKGVTQRHADEGYARVVKLVALAKAERLNDLTLGRLQAALALLRGKGLGASDDSSSPPAGQELLALALARRSNSRRPAGASPAPGQPGVGPPPRAPRLY